MSCLWNCVKKIICQFVLKKYRVREGSWKTNEQCISKAESENVISIAKGKILVEESKWEKKGGA